MYFCYMYLVEYMLNSLFEDRVPNLYMIVSHLTIPGSCLETRFPNYSLTQLQLGTIFISRKRGCFIDCTIHLPAKSINCKKIFSTQIIIKQARSCLSVNLNCLMYGGCLKSEIKALMPFGEGNSC